ncbi:MAG: hypothetical protein L0332_00635 [Chloroflexi bacterium]|nr:hypothetical protein [Chloroflexota bacterium]MCI0577592.1 hypothetical protein [Chloroflexota bacterium]MCI0644188.1 hypothetical protein [Chloroflexota bacterium]MCI0725229.1 hypothetical protein [Chloroflexota bacterium]
MTSNAALIAGAAAGVAGLLLFLTIHHLWIAPIWFILPVGLIVAALGGLAIGWSYAEIRDGLPPPPWTFPALAALVMATLVPAIILAELRPPLIPPPFTAIPEGQGGRVLVHFLLELLLTATLVGGAAGWLLGHSWRAVTSTALAGFIFALGPGHNIPLLGGTPAAGKGFILLLAIVLVAALVLVTVQARLSHP